MWIKDPKDSQPSVTLTFCVIFAIVAGVGCIMEYTGHGKAPEAAVDLFWGALASYVGRRFTFKGKSFGGDSEPK